MAPGPKRRRKPGTSALGISRSGIMQNLAEMEVALTQTRAFQNDPDLIRWMARRVEPDTWRVSLAEAAPVEALDYEQVESELMRRPVIRPLSDELYRRETGREPVLEVQGIVDPGPCERCGHRLGELCIVKNRTVGDYCRHWRNANTGCYECGQCRWFGQGASSVVGGVVAYVCSPLTLAKSDVALTWRLNKSCTYFWRPGAEGPDSETKKTGVGRKIRKGDSLENSNT